MERSRFAMALMLMVACSKTRPHELRDPATLPHEDRLYPVVTSDVPLEPPDTSQLRACYDEALQRDATLGGRYVLTVAARDAFGLAAALSVKTGTIDERLRFCITNTFAGGSAFHLDAGARADIELTLRAEMRHEPMRPGGVAVDAEAHRLATDDDVRVLRTELTSAFFDGFNDERRLREVHMRTHVEITRAGTFTTCGSLRDFAPAESVVPCRKVHRAKGEVVAVEDVMSFTLEANGWSAGSRHWFGDVPLEVK